MLWNANMYLRFLETKRGRYVNGYGNSVSCCWNRYENHGSQYEKYTRIQSQLLELTKRQRLLEWFPFCGPTLPSTREAECCINLWGQKSPSSWCISINWPWICTVGQQYIWVHSMCWFWYIQTYMISLTLTSLGVDCLPDRTYYHTVCHTVCRIESSGHGPLRYWPLISMLVSLPILDYINPFWVSIVR